MSSGPGGLNWMRCGKIGSRRLSTCWLSTDRRFNFRIHPASTDRDTRTWGIGVQSQGNPLRVFYAFDPGNGNPADRGDKTGQNRFYRETVKLADQLYDTYLKELKAEGLL